MTENETAPVTAAPESKSMDDIVALCKRVGFVYPASEIYGGINGFWDYGPLGVQLKNNIRDHWWKHLVEMPPLGPDGEPVEIVGLDSAIIQNPKVWEASGHVGGFSDPMVDDTETKQRYRADKVWVIGFMKVKSIDQHLRRLQKFVNDLKKSDYEGDPNQNPLTLEMLSESRRTRTPDIFFAVEGDSLLNSLPAARDRLTKRQRKEIGIDSLIAEVKEKGLAEELESAILMTVSGYSVLDLPTAWPRLSPATQRETLTEPRDFNLMFETYVGAVRDEKNKTYLRPETAQGIFLNFKNVVDTTRVKMPFGIAQIGKSFRNEVTPRNFIFRSREFEQMEMEWFCAPDEAPQWYEYWKQKRMEWWESLGIAKENLRFRDHDEDELAHYSKMCVDVEYKYPFTAPGFGELEGIAHRGDYDLTQHQEHSGQKLDYFDQERQVRLQNEGLAKEEIKERSRYIPNVIEPASGLTRAVLVLLCEAYTPDDSRPSGVYMKFPPFLAPVQAAVFPLVNKQGMPEKARELYMQLRKRFRVETDAKQSIGKRYARMDEIGCPYCITIDGDTLNDDTVTLRDRDTQEQQRLPMGEVEAFLAEQLTS